jgi:CRP-like cAMP-binding protein
MEELVDVSWVVSAELFEHYFTNNVRVTYRKGQVIFTQGSPADVVYWLRKGMVDIYRSIPDGRRTLVRLCGAGEIIGFADVINSASEWVQLFEAFARTSSEVVLITREYLTRLLRDQPSSKLTQLIGYLNRAWAKEAERWTRFLVSDCRERLQSVIVDLADRFGAQDRRGIMLVPQLSHQDLAELAGFSRAMTSKVVGELLREGVLEYSDGRYIVPNTSELAALIPNRIESRPRSLIRAQFPLASGRGQERRKQPQRAAHR